jgi:hypothetical protein
MTSSISLSALNSQIVTTGLNISGQTEDTTPDLLNDTLILFLNGQQNGNKLLPVGALPVPYQETYFDSLGTGYSQSTAGVYIPIVEGYFNIPPSKVWHIEYAFQNASAALTTGMFLRLNIDANTTLVAGNGYANSSSTTTGLYVTFNGDSSVVTSMFTNTKTTDGMICGHVVLRNTSGSATAVSFFEFSTEVDTSAATIPTKGTEMIGRFWSRTTELA